MLSEDAVQFLVAKYAAEAASRCPSIAAKQVTPHVLRHTCAMFLQLSTVAADASFDRVNNSGSARKAALLASA